MKIVIVGASTAGLAALYQLLSGPFDGSVTVVDADPSASYDRTALSTQFLRSDISPQELGVGIGRELDADWIVGTRASSLDCSGRLLGLQDGRSLHFDRLLLATGGDAPRDFDLDVAACRKVFWLRSITDACALRERLRSCPGRVIVVGAGLLGCEVASACVEAGVSTTLVARGRAPLSSVLGPTIGAAVAGRIMEQGVVVVTEASVHTIASVSGSDEVAVFFTDGRALVGDTVVVSNGLRRDVRWLQSAGLAVSPKGLDADEYCRALAADGRPADGVFVAGDLTARECSVGGEHWARAVSQGRTAASNMVATPDRWIAGNGVGVPVFWSHQFGLNIKVMGDPSRDCEMFVTEGDLAVGGFAAVYVRHSKVVGAVTVNRSRCGPLYQEWISSAYVWKDQALSGD